MDRFTQSVIPVGKVTPDGLLILGTGFYIGVDDLFVTSRHVVGDNLSNLVVIGPNISSINAYQDVSDDICHVADASIYEINPIADLVLLRTGNKVFDAPELGSLDDIKVGEIVEIYGFPHCLDGRRVLTYQSASIGAKVFLQSSSLKVKHAVINSQTRPGQSGSLVFSRRLGKVVGLLSGTYAPSGAQVRFMGINPAELNQTSHVVSAEYIKDMI
ncbi:MULTISPECIES: S1 family peptidase [Pseudomonas]|uniref:S1 family peptidase n=1 Tax=Pseudomonas TaxID=286 RepID=UPI0009B5E4D4|nr:MULTISPECIES: serine protease [Pseudomonas]WOB61275.1 serine protease [Pseudomonas sp. NBB]